ncbi:MAG: LysR family transcriptional regulator [Coriobacteriales bacterium]|jgi:DNA-binding transcriptional LysR family regulator|nr:LysR family transcriptional regulator [Coriobacteriales bacterium]
MQISHLKEFLVVADSLNFTAAAKKLHISQPVLSQHIRALERNVEAELFARDRHRIRLTEIGKVFYSETIEIVDRLDLILDKITLMKTEISNTLKVGYLHWAYRQVLSEVAQGFSNRNPGVDLQLFSLDMHDVTQSLITGSVDIALTIDIDEELHESCNLVSFGWDPLCVVVRFDDPWLGSASLSLSDLSNEAFIVPHPKHAPAFYRYNLEIFRKAGFEPKVSYYYKDIDTRYLEIEAGNGIGLMAKHLEPMLPADLRLIPLSDVFCGYRVVALWKKTSFNQSISLFLKALSISKLSTLYRQESRYFDLRDEGVLPE